MSDTYFVATDRLDTAVNGVARVEQTFQDLGWGRVFFQLGVAMPSSESGDEMVIAISYMEQAQQEVLHMIGTLKAALARSSANYKAAESQAVQSVSSGG